MEHSQGRQRLSLELIVTAFPVAAALSRNLPVGDLISLSRTSAGLRAALHGFETPEPPPPTFNTDSYKAYIRVRRSLHIGQHATLYWQGLKGSAQYVCTSSTHKRGDDAKPCRYCSRPICQGCIVKSSFARITSSSSSSEGTFKNRCRSLCVECWDNGIVSRSHKFPLLVPADNLTIKPGSETKKRSCQEDFCTCSYKDDAWLCIECKDKQNFESTKLDSHRCHAQGCMKNRGAGYERRQICRWCDKPTEPRSTVPRHTWNARMFQAQLMAAESRTADLDEYHKRRFAMSRMTRREMKGDQAVQNDPRADVKQFVRNLDIVNYRRFMSIDSVPEGDAIYNSKRGFWRYNLKFLKKFRHCCPKLQDAELAAEVASTTAGGANQYTQTNNAKSITWSEMLAEANSIRRNRTGSRLLQSEDDKQKAKVMADQFKSIPESRLLSWHMFRSQVLSAYASTEDFSETREHMMAEYDFEASEQEYEIMLRLWGFVSFRNVHDCTDASGNTADLVSYGHLMNVEKRTEGSTETDEADLIMAKTLQEQLDQEFAESLQVDMYYDDLVADDEDEDEDEDDGDQEESSILDFEDVTSGSETGRPGPSTSRVAGRGLQVPGTEDGNEDDDRDVLTMPSSSRSQQHTPKHSRHSKITGHEAEPKTDKNVVEDKSDNEDEAWELV